MMKDEDINRVKQIATAGQYVKIYRLTVCENLQIDLCCVLLVQIEINSFFQIYKLLNLSNLRCGAQGYRVTRGMETPLPHPVSQRRKA